MIKVKVGACIGSNQIQSFKKERIGDFVSVDLPEDKKSAMSFARFCKTNRIYFKFNEIRPRSDYQFKKGEAPAPSFPLSRKDLEGIIKEGGQYYLGRIILGEAGGVLYWPREYLINRKQGAFLNMPDAGDMADAKDKYLTFIRNGTLLEKRLGGGPLSDVDSSLVFKYHLEGGIDTATLEALPGDSNLMYAAMRGASRAYGRKDFGAHIAMSWYGGGKLDPLSPRKTRST